MNRFFIGPRRSNNYDHSNLLVQKFYIFCFLSASIQYVNLVALSVLYCPIQVQFHLEIFWYCFYIKSSDYLSQILCFRFLKGSNLCSFSLQIYSCNLQCSSHLIIEINFSELKLNPELSFGSAISKIEIFIHWLVNLRHGRNLKRKDSIHIQ